MEESEAVHQEGRDLFCPEHVSRHHTWQRTKQKRFLWLWEVQICGKYKH